jgi:hypothetical protein
MVWAAAHAGDTDLLYALSRQDHLDKMESQKIIYEERAWSRLEEIYSMGGEHMVNDQRAIDTLNMNDPAMKSAQLAEDKMKLQMPPQPEANQDLEPPSLDGFIKGGRNLDTGQ